MSDPNTHDIREHQRMDLISFLARDPQTGEEYIAVQPHPERYEWVEKAGERLLFDRYEGFLIPEDVLRDAVRQAVNIPRPAPLGVLADIDRYIAVRRPAVRARLKAKHPLTHRSDASENFLAARANDKLAFVAMSIDVVGSSQMAHHLSTERLSLLLGTLADELSELVAVFHGHVLRYTGDGLIAYFPGPGFITPNDLAVDCGLCVQCLVASGLNPELQAEGFAPVEVRVGLDAGEAAVIVLGSSRTKRHADLVGDVVSLACHIEKSGDPGDVRIGATVARNLHVSWRSQCEDCPLPERWTFRDYDGEAYGIQRLKPGTTRPIEADLRN